MSKMKRTTRGILALGITLSLAFATVVPIFAATIDDKSDMDPNTGEKLFEGDSYGADDTENPTAGTIVVVDNDASYTVTVAKKIVIDELSSKNSDKTYTYTASETAKPFIKVTECDLSAGQTLTAKVSNVNLRNSLGGLTGKLTTEFTGDGASGQTMTLVSNTASTYRYRKGTTNDGTGTINDYAGMKFTIDSTSKIYAGTWHGVMTYTMNLTRPQVDSDDLDGTTVTEGSLD